VRACPATLAPGGGAEDEADDGTGIALDADGDSDGARKHPARSAEASVVERIESDEFMVNILAL
jgi:hypothetical protein